MDSCNRIHQLPSPPYTRRNSVVNTKRDTHLPMEIVTNILSRITSYPVDDDDNKSHIYKYGATLHNTGRKRLLSLLSIKSGFIMNDVLRKLHNDIIIDSNSLPIINIGKIQPKSLRVIGGNTISYLSFEPYSFQSFGNRIASIDPLNDNETNTLDYKLIDSLDDVENINDYMYAENEFIDENSNDNDFDEYEMSWHSNLHVLSSVLITSIYLLSLSDESDTFTTMSKSTLKTSARILQGRLFVGYRKYKPNDIVNDTNNKRKFIIERIWESQDSTNLKSTQNILLKLLLTWVMGQSYRNYITDLNLKSYNDILLSLGTDIISQAGEFTENNLSTVFYANRLVRKPDFKVSNDSNKAQNNSQNTESKILSKLECLSLEELSCKDILLKNNNIESYFSSSIETLRAVSFAGSCATHELFKSMSIVNHDNKISIIDLSRIFAPRGCCSSYCNSIFSAGKGFDNDSHSLQILAEHKLVSTLFYPPSSSNSINNDCITCTSCTLCDKQCIRCTLCMRETPYKLRFPNLTLLILLACPLIRRSWLNNLTGIIQTVLHHPLLVAYCSSDHGSFECRDICSLSPNLFGKRA